jgi:predicted transcriptional regulator
MKKLVRRDRMKIYRDILSVIQSSEKTEKIILTRIQQKTNVPFDRLKAYVLELGELGLIQNEPSPMLTEKGQKYLIEYEKVQEFMKRMGLAYQDET